MLFAAVRFTISSLCFSLGVCVFEVSFFKNYFYFLKNKPKFAYLKSNLFLLRKKTTFITFIQSTKHLKNFLKKYKNCIPSGVVCNWESFSLRSLLTAIGGLHFGRERNSKNYFKVTNQKKTFVSNAFKFSNL